MIILLLFTLLNAQLNLIRNGDFQLYSPTIRALYDSQVVYFDNFDPTDSWYGNPTFQVKNFTDDSDGPHNRLDTVSDKNNYKTCQNITMELHKTYLLSFQYFVDYDQRQYISVILNDQAISYLGIDYGVIHNFSQIITSTSETAILCFIGFYDEIQNLYPYRGPLLDNIEIYEAVFDQYVAFSINEEQEVIELVSNISIDAEKINLMLNTTVFIDSKSSEIVGLEPSFLSISENCYFTIKIKRSQNYTRTQKIQIILPQYDYTDASGYAVRFIITSITFNSTFLEDFDLQDQLVNSLVEFFKAIDKLRVFACTAILFKMIAFANISIIYIFLDIGHLHQTIRIALQKFAEILLGKGLLEFFGEYVLNRPITFENLYFETTETITQIRKTKGSQYSVIGLSSNLTICCLDDFAVFLINLVKITILYLIFRKFSKNPKVQAFVKNIHIHCLYRITVLIEFISIAPVWLIAIFARFVEIDQGVTSSIFNDKANLLGQLSYVCIFALCWVYLHKLLRTTTKKEKSLSPSVEENIQAQNERKKPKRVYIWNKFERVQSILALQFLLIGPLSTFSQPQFFLGLITFYHIFCCGYLIYLREKSLVFLQYFLRKLWTLLFHLGFCGLYLLTKLENLTETEAIRFETIISTIILYSFIVGCSYQILIASIKLLLQIFKISKILFKLCETKNRIQHKPETKKQIVKKKEQKKSQREKQRISPSKPKQQKKKETLMIELPKSKQKKIQKSKLSPQNKVIPGQIPTKPDQTVSKRIKLNITMKKKKASNALKVIKQQKEEHLDNIDL